MFKKRLNTTEYPGQYEQTISDPNLWCHVVDTVQSTAKHIDYLTFILIAYRLKSDPACGWTSKESRTENSSKPNCTYAKLDLS